MSNPLQSEQTMTKSEDKAKVIAIKELLEQDEYFVRSAACRYEARKGRCARI